MPRGSKPGERRGGRKKGTPNNAKVRVAEIMARAVASAAAEGRKWTPLEWMLYVLNHPDTLNAASSGGHDLGLGVLIL